MHRAYKSISVLMCVILLSLLSLPNAFAATKQGRITKDKVNMRNKATTVDSTVILTLSADTVVTINSKTNGQEAESGGGITWYNITYEGKTGYVYGKYVEEIVAATYDANFEKNLSNFPNSYRSALRKIHNTYPNWIFVADKVNVSLDTAINYEYSSSNLLSTKKWVELSYGIEWRDPRVDTENSNHIKETRWTFASRQAIAYFMDPRNALVVTNKKASFPNVFTFLQQSYDSSIQNKTGLATVVSGTFLANGYGGNKSAYLDDIMQAANDSGVSPYVIAGTIIIEQGKNGSSSLISGKYKGYEGYYNFFNYDATGANVVKSGLKYAKKKGWNSRRASIVGGAKLYAEGYINKGQDTYYYMDFNVKSKGNKQYANSLYDQCTKAVSIRAVCTANKNAAMTFKIPVYSSLPSAVYKAPTIEEYSKAITNNSGAATTTSSKSATSVTRKKGDVSGDSKVDGRDLAFIKLYLLDLKKLKSAELQAADVSGTDGVNGRDLAIVKLYLLGLKSL